MRDHIGVEDLCGRQREIAELIGIGNYLKLVKRFGGDSLYIQVSHKLAKSRRNAEIKRNFTGKNYNELAQSNNLSARQVRNIIPRNIVANIRNKPLENQVSFY
jgi:Mor family transcriptional regulator